MARYDDRAIWAIMILITDRRKGVKWSGRVHCCALNTKVATLQFLFASTYSYLSRASHGKINHKSKTHLLTDHADDNHDLEKNSPLLSFPFPLPPTGHFVRLLTKPCRHEAAGTEPWLSEAAGTMNTTSLPHIPPHSTVAHFPSRDSMIEIVQQLGI